MLDLITTFLVWDLALAGALALVLGAVVVLQGAFHFSMSLLRRPGRLTPSAPRAAVGVVLLPAPVLGGPAGSGP